MILSLSNYRCIEGNLCKKKALNHTRKKCNRVDGVCYNRVSNHHKLEFYGASLY